jgi:hypothetical protein
VPQIPIAKLDVFAILDSDTPEAKQFQTYLFYWRRLSREIADRYSSDYGPALTAMFFKRSLGCIADCSAYANALRTYAGATMFLFEAFVGQRAKRILVDAATDCRADSRNEAVSSSRRQRRSSLATRLGRLCASNTSLETAEYAEDSS